MEDDQRARTRRHVLEIAAGILERDGAHALSTRSVAAAAGIRAASLYGLFEDKDGLLAALAVHAFEQYLAQKRALPRAGDAIENMRRGWDAHVEFGLRHPALYLLMYGTDRPGRRPPAAEQARNELLTFLNEAAHAGHLRVEPALAADVLYAGVVGTTLALIGEPDSKAGDRPATDRDPRLSATTREALIRTLTTVSPTTDSESTSALAARALALDAALSASDDTTLPLRPTEAALLQDWLHQLAR